METAELAAWAAAFAAFHARFAAHFVRSEARERSARYLQGLCGSVERKNGWQLAEATGEARPLGVQRLLYEAVWDADAVRATYAQWVAETFGSADAILVLDETGFLKKGKRSVGVARQYSGTAGKVENCQVAVFLAYATATSHVLLDRRLYLPHAWCEDTARRATARIPAAVTFATKPELGLAMIDAARAQGLAHAWVAGDEAYGAAPSFLAGLEERGERYVVAVPKTRLVWPAGTCMRVVSDRVAVLAAAQPAPQPVATVVTGWEAAAWQRLSVGDGGKGPRQYDWAAVRVVASREGWPGPTLWLLARRSVSTPTEVAYYLAHAPEDTPLAELATVAGQRWAIEQCFEEAKGETGLDQYEVRGWPSWRRHITLALLAHGFLASLRQAAGEKRNAGRAGVDRRDGASERAGGAPAADADLAPAGAVGGHGTGVVGLAARTSRPRQTPSLRAAPPVGCHPARQVRL